MQLSALGIDDGRIAGLDRVEHTLGLADGGNSKRTRHDGHMARGTTFLGTDRANAAGRSRAAPQAADMVRAMTIAS
jgi:hypothetical protein